MFIITIIIILGPVLSCRHVRLETLFGELGHLRHLHPGAVTQIYRLQAMDTRACAPARSRSPH